MKLFLMILIALDIVGLPSPRPALVNLLNARAASTGDPAWNPATEYMS